MIDTYADAASELRAEKLIKQIAAKGSIITGSGGKSNSKKVVKSAKRYKPKDSTSSNRPYGNKLPDYALVGPPSDYVASLLSPRANSSPKKGYHRNKHNNHLETPIKKVSMDDIDSAKSTDRRTADKASEMSFLSDRSLMTKPVISNMSKASPKTRQLKLNIDKKASPGSKHNPISSKDGNVTSLAPQKLGFGHAIESIAALKLHNYATKKRVDMSQKLKVPPYTFVSL